MEQTLRLFNLLVAVEPSWWERRRALELVRSLVPSARLFAETPSLLFFKVEKPYETVRLLSEKLTTDDPVLRIIPIDAVTPPYPSHVAKAAAQLVRERARREWSFAVKLEGHLFDEETGRRLHKADAIRVIADNIELKVNLDNPDLLVLVKVVRVSRSLYYAAIMAAPPCAIYSRARNRQVCSVPWAG